MELKLPLNLKGLKIEDLLKYKTLLIGILIGLVALGYAYNKIYKNTMGSVHAIKAQIKGEGSKLEVSKRLEALQGELEGYKGYFAGQTDILWLIGKVSGCAKKSGLEIISLNSHPLVAVKNFLYGTVGLTVHGTFNQLGDFVSSIEESSEFMRIEKLSFEKDKEFLNADIVVGTYFWKG